ncbi:uncharacterized protein LOC127797322 [Diospyros lotus]|uniref:uncharacterized protein LOC127797322 n=1 Tax=Diospyros lotus TaxID=55363 RepID=UPI002258CBDB|nr:uncharacterized protein LOC127797322 [Diospyros lotus]
MVMEDPNMLAADCIVISCCCQCLVLQIIIILLKLPSKLARKTSRYAKKKLCRRRRKVTIEKKMDEYGDEYQEEEGFDVNEWQGCGGCCCMEEVEKVLEELSQKGRFAFGSFWCGEELESSPQSAINYHLIEMVQLC